MAITRGSGVDNSTLAWAAIAPAAGDLVFVIFANDGGDNQTGLTDFTRLGTDLAGTTGVELGIYWRECTGAESGTIIASESSFGVTGEEYTWHWIKIPAAEWHGTTAPEVGTASSAGTGTPDCPPISPSWGAETGTIFIPILCRDDNDGIAASPTDYTTNFLRTEGTTAGPELATSWRIPSPAVATEDPGTWSVTGTAEEYGTNIVAVRGPAGPVITSIDTDNDTVDTRTGVAIAGSNFGASETGSAKVEISNNATYGSGTVVEIDVTSWSATSITVTLRRESDSAALAGLFTLPLSPAYLWVTDSAGTRNAAGFQFTLRPPGPTPFANLNTPATLEVDTTYLVRVRVENTGGVGDTDFRWVRSHESGAWTPITTTSSVVKAVAASSFANGDDVPEVIGGAGSYIANNDAASEDGTITLPAAFSAGGAVEFVLAFQIVAADVSDEDAILLRLEQGDGTDFDTYTNTASITVNKEAAGATIAIETGSFGLTGAAVGLLQNHLTGIETGSFALTGGNVTLLENHQTSIDGGSFALTGADIDFREDHIAVIEAGAFALTGADVALRADHVVSAEAGEFVLTGADIDLIGGIRIALDPGAFSLVGADVGLRQDHLTPIEAGVFELTGGDIGLTRHIPIEIETGSFALSGSDVALRSDHRVSIESGEFALTGADITLIYGEKLGVEPGVFALTGADIGLRWDRLLALESGEFTLTGADVDLAHTQAFEIAVNGGIFELTGGEIGLRQDHLLAINGGEFALTGAEIILRQDHAVAIEGGAYVLTGADVTLVFTPAFGMAVDAGAFLLSGADVGLRHDRLLDLEGGSYSLTGADIGLGRHVPIELSGGAFLLSGTDIILLRNRRTAIDAGAFSLIGADIGLYLNASVPDLVSPIGVSSGEGSRMISTESGRRAVASDGGLHVVSTGGSTSAT